MLAVNSVAHLSKYPFSIRTSVPACPNGYHCVSRSEQRWMPIALGIIWQPPDECSMPNPVGQGSYSSCSSIQISDRCMEPCLMLRIHLPPPSPLSGKLVSRTHVGKWNSFDATCRTGQHGTRSTRAIVSYDGQSWCLMEITVGIDVAEHVQVN